MHTFFIDSTGAMNADEEKDAMPSSISTLLDIVIVFLLWKIIYFFINLIIINVYCSRVYTTNRIITYVVDNIGYIMLLLLLLSIAFVITFGTM